jgi:hypothetical protein
MVHGASGRSADVSGRQEFAIATGSVDITPPTRVPLASYRGLRKPTFDTVADALEADVVVLHQGGEPAAVLVSADLLYVGAEICDRVFKALAGRVARERIFLGATHTHFAPATEKSLPALGQVAQEYLEYAATRIIALIERLLAAPPAPAVCRYHEGAAHHSINRRRARFGLWKRYPFIGFRTEIAPNEDAPRDDLIRVLTLTGPDGRLGAICWAFACHPNTFPQIDSVSAEYPGRVRQLLRKQFGPIPVLFWQGFSGNINPYRTSSGAGREDGQRPRFVAQTISQWQEWADSLAEKVRLAVATPGRPVDGPVVGEVRSLGVRELGLRSDKQLTCQKISFGSGLVICGLSAEVAVEYVARLRAVLPSRVVIPVGCTEDVFGYLPVDEMIGGGGYEVRGFLRRFGLRGRFHRDVAGIVERRLLVPDGGGPQPMAAAGLSGGPVS